MGHSYSTVMGKEEITVSLASGLSDKKMPVPGISKSKRLRLTLRRL